MMMRLRMIVTWLLLGLSQPSHSAVMRLDYGVVGYYFNIEFTQGMFEKILTHLSDPRANVVSMNGTEKGLTITVQSVRIEYTQEATNNAETPKYSCEYYSKDKSFKCQRIPVLMTCPASKTKDLFGIKLKPGEFFNDTILASTTRTCKGESDSVWAITFYWKVVENPIYLNSVNALKEQEILRTTPRINYDDTLSDFTGVETSSLKNVHTTESKEAASDASVTVIVASIVVALIVITAASVVFYCLVCRRRQRRRSTNLNHAAKTIPRYEEVRFLPDNEMPHPGSNNNGNHVNFSGINCGRPHPGRITDGNFSGISNIYSYPFPYSVNKKQDKKPNGDIPNDHSLSDYSNPVDSYYDPRQINQNNGEKYTELESSSLSSKRAFWKRKKSDYAPETSEYSNPDDSYHVPRSLHDSHSEISPSNNYTSKYTELESTTYSMNDEESPYKLSNTPPVYSDPMVGAPEKNKNTLSIHEYNKLGEDTKELIHEYDHLEENSK